MSDATDIMRDRQRAIRREIDRRGIALKAIAFDAKMPINTLLSYFPGGEALPAVIPSAAIYKILDGNALPLELMSMLMPSGICIVHAPEEVDHDDLEAACRDYLKVKGEAHHPASPAGREIAPCENEALSRRAVALKVAA